MLTLIFRYLKDRRIIIIVFCCAAIATTWMYVALFPSMQAQSKTLTEAFNNYPEGLFKAMGLESFSFDRIENFLAMEYFSIFWPLMAIFLGASLASGSLAREVEKGTIELVLARPISRLKLFASRYIASCMALIVFTAVSVFCIIPLAAIHNIDYSLKNFALVAIVSFLFAWASFSLSMLFSAIFSDKGKVAMTMGGVLVLMYVLNIISALKTNLSDLQYLSFFHYYMYNEALIHANLKAESILLFVAVAVVSTILGAWYFFRRDVAV